MRYEYVLFDLDGTLSNTSPGVFNATDYMIKELGYRDLSMDEKRSILGPPLWQSFHNFFGIDGDELALAIEKYREYYHTKGCYENIEYEGMFDLLKDLKNRGVTLMVATSKPNNVTPQVLEGFGISELFDYVSSPNPEDESDDKSILIKDALNAVGCKDLSKALMVGDRLFDIKASNKVGIDSVGVAFGFGGVDELKEYNATYIVNSPKEILKIVVG